MAKPRIPADLRARLEQARLDALALFRALDQLDITADEMPQQLLRDLFELDADYAEALWALDQPPTALDFDSMVADTLASLAEFKAVRASFVGELPPRSSSPLEKHRAHIRSTLRLDDAYRQVPGRDPELG